METPWGVLLSVAMLIIASLIGVIQMMGLKYVSGIRDEMKSLSARLEAAIITAQTNSREIGILKSQRGDLERRLEVLAKQIEKQTEAMNGLQQTLIERWSQKSG